MFQFNVFKRKCERTVRMGIKITSNIIFSFKHIFFNQNENVFFLLLLFLLFLTDVQIQEVFQQPSQFNHPVVTRDPFGNICFLQFTSPARIFTITSEQHSPLKFYLYSLKHASLVLMHTHTKMMKVSQLAPVEFQMV